MRKKTVKSAVSFGTFGTYECKSCMQNVGEIDTLRCFVLRKCKKYFIFLEANPIKEIYSIKRQIEA